MREALRRVTSCVLWLWRAHLIPPVFCGVVYLLTLAPGVYGYDSAELATGAYTLGIVHPTGYPLYLLLGKLFTLLPVGSIAYRVNLMSAFFAALTVWLVARLAVRWIRSPLIAGLAATTLGLTPAFWSLAVVAEVYTLHTFLLAANLTLALQWRRERKALWLGLLALVSGLSLTNHVSSAMYIPGLVLLCIGDGRGQRLRRWLPALGLLFLAGLSLYAYLPIRDAATPGINYVRQFYNVNLQSLSGLWWMVSGQAYRFFVFAYGLKAYLIEVWISLVSLWHNLTGLGLGLAMLGALVQWRANRHVMLATAWIMLSTLLFFAGYAVADKLTMILPAYLVLVLWMAVGARRLQTWAGQMPSSQFGRQVGRTLSPAVPAMMALMLVLMTALNWGRLDKSNAHGAEVFARQALSGVSEGALMVSQWSPAVTLEYFQQVEGLRTDVSVFNRSRFEVAVYYEYWRRGIDHSAVLRTITQLEREAIAEMARGRTVYGTEFDPMLANEYEYLPAGAVFQMIPRKPDT